MQLLSIFLKLQTFSTYTTPTSRNLRKNKEIVITKPDKGNGVVILDRKLYNNAIEKIISDTSKFEKLNEDENLDEMGSFITTFFT